MPRVFKGRDARLYSSSPRSDCLRIDTYWEGAGPVDVADRVHTSMPIFMVKEIHKRITAEIAEADKYACHPGCR